MEAMEMRPNIEQVIFESPVESKLWEAARKNGMLTMQEDALLKAFDGAVPYSEVTALGGLNAEDDSQADSSAPDGSSVPINEEAKTEPEPELSAPLSL
jgi:hypothetical protein